MTPLNPMTVLALIFIGAVSILAAYLYYHLWMEERNEKDRAYVEKYNRASDMIKLCNHNMQNYHLINRALVELDKMPRRNKEHVHVLWTEFIRQFGKIHLEIYLDRTDVKKRRAKKIAKRERVEL